MRKKSISPHVFVALDHIILVQHTEPVLPALSLALSFGDHATWSQRGYGCKRHVRAVGRRHACARPV